MQGLETKLFFYNGSSLLGNKEATEYILDAIGKADPDSEFARLTTELSTLPKEDIRASLEIFGRLGYNLMIGYLNQKIVGHIAYQRHQEEGQEVWKVFQRYVLPDLRSNGLGSLMDEHFLEHVRRQGVKRVKIGNGRRNPINARMNHNLGLKGNKLGIEVDEDTGWITILSSRPESPRES